MNSAGCLLLFVCIAVVHGHEYRVPNERPYYETNAKKTADGHHIWGGDMILTDEQLVSMTRGLDVRTARKDLKSRWPQGRIPFKISPELEVARENIFKAIAVWTEASCLQFYEAPNISPQVAHLILKKTGTGCNSWVGIYNTTSTQQIVSLDDGCHDSVQVIVHELGHALGLWHEQDRPDRDEYLTIHTENMAPADRVYFNNPQWDVDTYGLPYDYTSIMQYSVDAFNNNGRLTLVPKDPLAAAVMSRAKGPSFRDFKLVNLMYQCTSPCANTKCANGGYATSNANKNCKCMCAPGFGGPTCATKVAVEPSCLLTITSPTTIRTPNYPNPMPSRSSCAWLIKPPANKKIQVLFKTFKLLYRYDKTNKCVWDSLRVRQPDFQSDDPGTVYCSDELKGKSLTADEEMLLILQSSQYYDYSTGFEATISFV